MGLPDRLAPIVLFCYNRPRHLQQTIESLQKNALAPESELFIYSDGARNERDELAVSEVRRYVANVSGFKNVHVIAAERNKGLAASVIAGVSEVLTRNGKVIVLEDDMLSASDFLVFMNQALDTYAERPDIFSVTGYTPPAQYPAGYPNDVFLAPRASSWGWGTWVHKWAQADWQVRDFQSLKNDSKRQNAFNRGGEDLWPMLAKQQKGVIDSWAIRWTYAQFRNHAFGLYPVRSKIKNIGTDGTGTNFTFESGEYGQEMAEGQVATPADLAPDDAMIDAFARYYRLSILLKIKNRIKYGI